MRTRATDQSGFTLAEMMIASAITTVVMTLAVASFTTLTTATAASAGYTRLHGELRHAMDVIERDFRGGTEITWASADENSAIAFKTKTETGDTLVYFFTNGSQLYRWRDGTSTEIANGISSVEFEMFDENGNSTTSTGNAAAINVILNGSVKVLTKACTDKLQTRITMRNIDD